MIKQFLTVNLWWNLQGIQWPGFSVILPIYLKSSHVFSQCLRLIACEYMLEINKHTRWIQLWVSTTNHKCSISLIFNTIFWYLSMFEVMNIWKSYMWTAEWRIKWRMIIAVIYTTFAVVKRKPEKYSGLYKNQTLDLYDTGAALYQLS